MIERQRVGVPAGAAGANHEFNFLCRLLIRCPFHPVLPQWHLKDPGHSAKKCSCQVTPKHTYINDQTKSKWGRLRCPGVVWEPIGENELTHSSSGNTQPQSLQLAEPLWTDSGLRSRRRK